MLIDEKDIMKTALVLGANGATGFSLCKQLLNNKRIHRIIALSRKNRTPLDEMGPKLQRIKTDLFSLESLNTLSNSKIDFIYCCLGTTRQQAGSAANFRRVDFELCFQLAKIARQENIPYFSIVSAKGANPNLWSSPLRILHPLLYAQTKGALEKKLISLGFPCLHIFRPGLLNRNQHDRRVLESIALKILPSLDVNKLAKFMIRQSLSYRYHPRSKKFRIYEDQEIHDKT